MFISSVFDKATSQRRTPPRASGPRAALRGPFIARQRIIGRIFRSFDNAMTKIVEAKALAAAGKDAREVYQAADRTVQHFADSGHRTRPKGLDGRMRSLARQDGGGASPAHVYSRRAGRATVGLATLLYQMPCRRRPRNA